MYVRVGSLAPNTLFWALAVTVSAAGVTVSLPLTNVTLTSVAVDVPVMAYLPAFDVVVASVANVTFPVRSISSDVVYVNSGLAAP